jgi:biotin-(acetyl-CoA carboxylase) ligase
VHAPRATAASVALRVDWPDGTLGLVPLMAGMAARKAVADGAGVHLELKWPNDLMRGATKVGGVLVEASKRSVVAGCGINVWWPDAPPGMGAIGENDPGQDATFELAESWAREFVAGVQAGPGAWDRDAYVAACVTLGSDVAWNPNGRGRASDIAPDGGLIVETARGLVTLRSGEVRMVRPTTLGPATFEATSDERGVEPA